MIGLINQMKLKPDSYMYLTFVGTCGGGTERIGHDFTKLQNKKLLIKKIDVWLFDKGLEGQRDYITNNIGVDTNGMYYNDVTYGGNRLIKENSQMFCYANYGRAYLKHNNKNVLFGEQFLPNKIHDDNMFLWLPEPCQSLDFTMDEFIGRLTDENIDEPMYGIGYFCQLGVYVL